MCFKAYCVSVKVKKQNQNSKYVTMKLQTQLKWTLNCKEGSYKKLLKFDQKLHSTDICVKQVSIQLKNGRTPVPG